VEPAWSFLATCRIDSLRKRIIFLGVPTLGGRVVRRIAAVGLWPFQDDGYNTPDEGHYVVASLRSVPRSRIAEALPHSHWVNDSLFHMPCHPGSDGSSRAVYFHLFDNIRSLLEFADRFRLLPLLHDGCYGGA
jgi:hypothetical protein